MWFWMCGFYSRCFVQESRIERSIWEKPWSVKFRYRAAYCVLFFSNGQNFQGRCSLEYNVKFLARWRVGEFLFFKKKLLCAEGPFWGATLNPIGPKSSEMGLGSLVALWWRTLVIGPAQQYISVSLKNYIISVRVHWNKIILILMLTLHPFK